MKIFSSEYLNRNSLSENKDPSNDLVTLFLYIDDYILDARDDYIAAISTAKLTNP